MLTFVTTDFDPLPACLWFTNKNKAKLPQYIHIH